MNCASCGIAIPLGLTACASCKTPIPFSDRDRQRMEVDVRARVLWGDPLDAIQDDWLKKGAPQDAVTDSLKIAIRERKRHFRKRGALDLMMGIGLFLVATCGILILMSGYASGYLIAATVASPAGGIWFFIRGISRLTKGGEEDESASDISHSD